MTKLDCEMALIRVMDAAQEIYKAYNPAAHHLSMCFVDGTVMITGCVGVDENGDSIRDLDACRLPDGTHRFGGTYIESKEAIA